MEVYWNHESGLLIKFWFEKNQQAATSNSTI